MAPSRDGRSPSPERATEQEPEARGRTPDRGAPKEDRDDRDVPKEDRDDRDRPRRSRSPRGRSYSRSPRRHSRSPRRHSRSPRRHSRSPRRYSRSPRRYSRSPRRYSRSPRRDYRDDYRRDDYRRDSRRRDDYRRRDDRRGGYTRSGDRDRPAPKSAVLGIFNLSMYTTEDHLRDLFGKFGAVKLVNIITDRNTRRSRGFGFITFENEDDAEAAKEKMNGSEIDERPVRVDFSHTKKAHDPTPGMYIGRVDERDRNRLRDELSVTERRGRSERRDD